MSKITLIACIDKVGNLGYKNELLFQIKEDMQRFKEYTTGNIVVAGLPTFNSIISMTGRPLSDRTNVVLTRNQSYVPQFNEFVFHDVESILKGIKTMNSVDKEVFIIGGGITYKTFLPFADQVILTVVDTVAEKSDAKYPLELQNQLNFKIEHYEKHFSEKYNCEYSFRTYVKQNDPYLG